MKLCKHCIALTVACSILISAIAMAESPKPAPTPTKEQIAYAEQRIKEIDNSLAIVIRELQATPAMTLYNYLNNEKKSLQAIIDAGKEKKK